MTIRIYHDRIRFVGDPNIDLLIESDGLRFTGSLTTAYSVAYTAPPQASPMQGTVAGFTTGGDTYPSPNYVTTIDKFPFSQTSGTATDVGDLSGSRRATAGHSSNTDGFTVGGQSPVGYLTTIDKFPFSQTSGTAAIIGALSQGRSFVTPAPSNTDAFTSGGFFTPPDTRVTTIDKFPFSISSGTATDVGDIVTARNAASGQSSSTDGFVSGGFSTSPVNTWFTQIDKFPFSISNGTATDVGDLSVARSSGIGQSSTTDGFSSGGFSPTYQSQIDKFPFSISSGTATDVGDLTQAKVSAAGQSSTTDGFTAGGKISDPTPIISEIDKFPFSISSGIATDIGDLSQARSHASGHQD